MFKKRHLEIVLLTLFLFGFCLIAQAVELQVPIPGQPGAGKDLASYISAWYTFGVSAIGIIAVVMIMWSGMQWITAMGNATQIGQAKERISNAIVGLILALCSFGLLHLINPALVELKMPKIDIIEKVDIKESTIDIALKTIGKSCFSDPKICRGTEKNPVYDQMCYVGCPDGSDPVPEKFRTCVYIRDYRKYCKSSIVEEYLCVDNEQICKLKNDIDRQGNCCDERLVCNRLVGKCSPLGKEGDVCARNIECENGLKCHWFKDKCVKK